MFALADCNNFFVSCERVFRPDLEGRPVIVLSSNDGCAIARSNEAKALGIKMGEAEIDEAEMDEGDIIIVDRSVEPYNGCSAVCFIDGEFTVKRVQRHADHIDLIAANPKFPTIHITPDNEFAIWGVVTYVIKRM